MTAVWKTDFSHQVWVSTFKLDKIMDELWLEYSSDPRDQKKRVVSDDAQEKIKDYLGI